jgi:cellulose synthase/poly-beta-1,6-N-acetylglucosamine synthase-like glycosyltransferase
MLSPRLQVARANAEFGFILSENMQTIRNVSGISPFVSVVINFHNEAENIDMAPLSLSKQTYLNFEVILVDDGSTDETGELLLTKYQSLLPRTRLIRLEKPIGLRPARNFGVKNANGDIIITLDLHTKFDCRFIERIVDRFTNDANVGAVGSLVLSYGNKWFDRGMRAVEKLLFFIRKKAKGYNYVYGTAAAYNSKAIKEIGYLSTNNLVEDTDASWKLAKNRWKVLVVEDNVVFHRGPFKSFKGFMSKLFIGGTRAAFLFSRYKTKALYPLNLARFLFPLFIILSFIYPPIFFYSAAIYCIGLALVFMFPLEENPKNSIFGIICSLLLLTVSLLGTYYGIVAIITGKKINVD